MTSASPANFSVKFTTHSLLTSTSTASASRGSPYVLTSLALLGMLVPLPLSHTRDKCFEVTCGSSITGAPVDMIDSIASGARVCQRKVRIDPFLVPRAHTGRVPNK